MLLDKYKYLFFDLDGTLVDTGEGIINSVFYCAEKLDIKGVTYDVAKQFVGPPLVDSFMKHFGFDKEKATLCAKTFREYYADKGKFECEAYENMIDVLKELKNRGYVLYVATSKPTVFAQEILDKLEMSQYFVEVVGSNLDNTRSKKVEVINYIIEKYDLNPNQCLMIGDKNSDINGAKQANIDSLGVLYGYGDYEEISNANPTIIIEKIEDIIK